MNKNETNPSMGNYMYEESSTSRRGGGRVKREMDGHMDDGFMYAIYVTLS